MSVPNNPFSNRAQAAVRAELSGSDGASALGLTAVSTSPVLLLCRKLVERGHAGPMECYRGEVLCLRVRSIARAAGLEVNAHGTGFNPRYERRRGAPVSFGGSPGARQHPEETNAPASGERVEFDNSSPPERRAA